MEQVPNLLQNVAWLCAAIAMAAPATSLLQTVDQVFGARPGCAVLVRAQTGAVLAAHHRDQATRLLARPGSTVKPFTLLAALEQGQLEATSKMACPRRLSLQGRVLDCAHSPVPAGVRADTALAYSCNCFVARQAARLSSSALAAGLRRFGFTHLTVAETGAQRQLQGLGEDGVLVTPLSLAQAYRMLAAQAPAVITQGLREAVEFGTAQQAAGPGLTIAGKTGTTLSPDGGHRQAWFAGWAPAEKPEVVVVVYLPQGSGGGDAAPLAGKLFQAWRQFR